MSSKVLLSTVVASVIPIRLIVGWVLAPKGMQRFLFSAALDVARSDFCMVGLLFLLLVGAVRLSLDFTFERAKAR